VEINERSKRGTKRQRDKETKIEDLPPGRDKETKTKIKDERIKNQVVIEK
jgi:hypothetical protein